MARAPLAVGGARLGKCKAAPLWAVPGAAARAPPLWGPVRCLPDANQSILQLECRLPTTSRRRWSRARGVRSSSPPGCTQSCWQGPHSSGGLPTACRMLIRASVGKSVALHRGSRPLSRARGVRSSSPPGCARGCWQGPHFCGDQSAAFWMLIRESCGKSAACHAEGREAGCLRLRWCSPPQCSWAPRQGPHGRPR